MTENAKTNAVLRALFALPISAGHRLGAFFLWGMLLPVDPKAEKKAKTRVISNRYRLSNLELMQEKDRRRYRNNPEKEKKRVQEYRKNNPEVGRLQNLIWIRENPERRRAQRRTYLSGRRREDPDFKILTSIRTRINHAIHEGTKGAGTQALLGMEIPEYRIYLQGQFFPGMTWKNYGPVWHIDHKRPCASFDLTDPGQQRECFHWSNTQPMFAKENLQKGEKYVSA